MCYIYKNQDLINPQVELFTFNLICEDCTNQGYVLDLKTNQTTIYIKNTLTGIEEEPYELAGSLVNIVEWIILRQFAYTIYLSIYLSIIINFTI